MLDPLDLTVEDCTLLAQHYRNARLNFQKMEEEKPKTVERSRAAKLDAAATKDRVNNILGALLTKGLKGDSDE